MNIKKIIKNTFLFNYLLFVLSKYQKIKVYTKGEARILLYHRVEDVLYDPLRLCVSKENFYNQIKYLDDKYKIVSLKELVDNIKNNRKIRNHVVITFDDGYADNLYNALPILKELNIPATIFITAGKIGDDEIFYWDKNLDKKNQGRSVNFQELLELHSSSLIEIGAHTVSHPHLGKLADAEQLKEIKESKKILEKLIEDKVISFSYPFGTDEDCDKRAVNNVVRSGFYCACSNVRGFVKSKSNQYSLPRILIRDWNIKDLELNI